MYNIQLAVSNSIIDKENYLCLQLIEKLKDTEIQQNEKLRIITPYRIFTSNLDKKMKKQLLQKLLDMRVAFTIIIADKKGD
ncbi:hypothetical protein KLM65_18350 [Clostridioides difficile]|nr:hypothetical protein [Clostridioides difficile]